jgi:hypothetical protein
MKQQAGSRTKEPAGSKQQAATSKQASKQAASKQASRNQQAATG